MFARINCRAGAGAPEMSRHYASASVRELTGAMQMPRSASGVAVER